MRTQISMATKNTFRKRGQQQIALYRCTISEILNNVITSEYADPVLPLRQQADSSLGVGLPTHRTTTRSLSFFVVHNIHTGGPRMIPILADKV